MNITSELIQKSAALQFQKLPPEVIERTKYLFLDYLGVAARGALSRSGKIAQKMVCRLGRDPNGAVIIGTDITAGPPYAALANGIASHSIEMDDVVNEASLHPGVTIMSTALAAAHMEPCSGKKLLEAIVAGYEVVVRLGIALDPAAHYEQGFHPTATCGTFGSAVTASKILKLGRGEMQNALGIAGSQAAGSMEFLADGTFTKRFHGGWAAHSGLLAALLAREGFTGPATIIEGRFGFLKAYSRRPTPEKILTGWCEPYQVLRTSIKPHACCRYKQGPIDAILKIMHEHDLKAEDVDSVTLGILKAGFPLVVEPVALKRKPTTIVDAQFSMPFGAAVAILYGRAALDEYTPAKISSPQVRKMMSRIHCVSDDSLEEDFPRKWPATALIETNRGQKFSATVDYPRGDPENPLSQEALIEKFTELVEPVYSKERREKIIDRILSLEKIDTFNSVASLLPKA